jgi:type II secretory pathway pseudopilin PulG
METFTLDPRCWQIGRIFGRNPLLRRADRIEALVVLAALVVSLVAIPLVGAVGTAVYSVRKSRYAEEARERHTVMATVIDERVTDSGTTVVDARWPVTVGERSGAIALASPVGVGSRVKIWVDTDGNQVDPPTPTRLAVHDAVGTALGIAMIVSIGLTSLVTNVRSRLDLARDAQWEDELRCLEEDGGRRNRQ